jgi:pimeloyl-ACP methyl ester carboxylesterase
MKEAGMISTRAGRVHVAEHGEGPTVVLLHATLHDHHDFDPIADKLAAQFRVIAIDWPGHGRSEPALPTAELLADVLEDVVDELELPPAGYIGNSVGGYAAGRLAVRRPAAVTHLVLVNAGGFVPLPALARVSARGLGIPAVARAVTPRLVPAYMRSRTDSDRAIEARTATRARTREGARVVAALWRSFAAPSYDLSRSQIAAPTLVVWGRRDPLFPRWLVSRMPSPAKEFDTGHVVFSSDPDGFLAVTLPFLTG